MKPGYSRSSVACENCRKRKSRCDAESPCGQCTRRGEVCVYIPSQREKTSDNRFAAVHRRFDQLETRLDRLESIISRAFASKDQMTGQVTGQVAGQVAGARVSSRDDSRDAVQGFQEQRDGPSIGDTSHLRGSMLFNDRLALMKAHTVGGREGTSVYMSSVFLSILSPEDISSLAQRLGDPLLPQRLEESSHLVWRDVQGVFVRMLGDTTEFKPDLDILEASIGIFSRLHDAFIRPLAPLEEVGFGLMPKTPEPLKKGQLAAIILIGCIDIKLRKDFSVFSKEAVDAHERAAIYQAVRTLNFVRFSPPGFLQVRLSTLLVFLLLGFQVPYIVTFLDSIISMSTAIGLDDLSKRKHYSDKETEWRESVWLIICHIVYNFKIMLSEKPPQLQGSSPAWLKNMSTKPGMLYFGQEQCLHRIYNKAYETTFSIHDRVHSPQLICENIKLLDDDLAQWRKNISDEEWNREFDARTGVEGMMSFLSLTFLRLKYHYILLAIHTIPAFFPDSLPESFPLSLTKVAAAARALCVAGFSSYQSKGQCTLIAGAAVTSAVCTLLYKQLRYPSDLSNHADLELLQTTISSFEHSEWTSVYGQTPSVEIWRALLDIMRRYYELSNPATDQSFREDDRELLTHEILENNGECIIN